MIALTNFYNGNKSKSILHEEVDIKITMRKIITIDKCDKYNMLKDYYIKNLRMNFDSLDSMNIELIKLYTKHMSYIFEDATLYNTSSSLTDSTLMKKIDIYTLTDENLRANTTKHYSLKDVIIDDKE